MKPVKTKSALRGQIYKLVAPLTKGVYRDPGWECVFAVFDALIAAGATISIRDTMYRGDAHTASKTWTFDLTIFDFVLSGRLIATFCGTVQDPTDRYDICFII